MSFGLFNQDMDRRLADLQSAAADGAHIAVKFEPAFDHGYSKLPDRLVVAIAETDRKFTFDIPMAEMVAAQLALNGLAGAADQIRAAMPV